MTTQPGAHRDVGRVAGIPDADLDRLIAATMPANGADPKARDCDLLAEVPLPPGVDSAGPWRTDQAGHLLRDLSDGRLQHGDGEAVAACRLCAARDDGQVQYAVSRLSDGGVTLPSMTIEDVRTARLAR